MKLSKLTASFLMSAMLLSNVTAMANENHVISSTPLNTNNEYNVELINAPVQQASYYLEITGTINSIEKKANGTQMVYVIGENESEMYFVLSEDTYYVDDVKIEEGAKITGYYEAGRPMIMIYPPQYTIDIVAPASKDDSKEISFNKADKFNQHLVSKDNQLKLNISEKTQIILANGVVLDLEKDYSLEDLKSELTNRLLFVTYTASTKSMPAITIPERVIVLSDKIIDTITNIEINGENFKNTGSFLNEKGTVMVPVRLISEALGLNVLWNNNERTIEIADTSFKIGDNEYHATKGIVYAEEPIIKDDVTYVPLSFFNEVLEIPIVAYIDNSIIINDKDYNLVEPIEQSVISCPPEKE